ncbi:MAG: hypothetical protein ACKV2O_19820 [Acidimicrobiales bacterium]
MPRLHPSAYPIDVGRYRGADHGWLDELDEVAVHAGRPHQLVRSDERCAAELGLKRRLFEQAADEVFRALPGSEDASVETAALVAAWLYTHDPSYVAAAPHEPHPLITAALSVQEDLCPMQRDAASTVHLPVAVAWQDDGASVVELTSEAPAATEAFISGSSGLTGSSSAPVTIHPVAGRC